MIIYFFSGFKHQFKFGISNELYHTFPIMVLNVIVREPRASDGRCRLRLVQEVVHGLLGTTCWESD